MSALARTAWIAVAAAAILRVLVTRRLWEEPAHWVGDARVFLRITEGLRSGTLVPDAWVWPPGYPLLGSVFSAPAGPGAGLVLASLLTGIAAPALILAGGIAAGRTTAAAIAAVAFAFFPDAVLAAGSPLSDAAALSLVVATVLLAETAFRRGGPLLAAGAAVAGGLAALTRPETLLAAAPLVLFGGRRRRTAVTYAAVLVVTVLPYAIALKSVSGAWGLTLKPQLNIRKLAVYQGEGSYGEIRAAWGETLREFQDEAGALDPRKLAKAASPREFLTSGAALEAWWAHARVGVGHLPAPVLALGVLGLVGLAWPRAAGGRERMLAATASLPFLAVPFFVAPMGRFVLPALPAVAWGLGCLGASLVEAARPPARSHLVALLTVLLIAAGGAGGITSWREADRIGWMTHLAEIKAALEREQPDRALELLAPFLETDPENPEVWETLGNVQESRGDDATAEDSFRRAVKLGASPVRLANLLARTGRIDEAESAIDPLRANPPESADYWMLTGNLAFVAGQWEEAAQSFLRARGLGGPPQELAFNRALALGRAGEIVAAIEELKLAEAGPSASLADRARGLRERYEAAGAP